MYVSEVYQYVSKNTPFTHVIKITWLWDPRVCIPELSGEREYPYTI